MLALGGSRGGGHSSHHSCSHSLPYVACWRAKVSFHHARVAHKMANCPPSLDCVANDVECKVDTRTMGFTGPYGSNPKDNFHPRAPDIHLVRSSAHATKRLLISAVIRESLFRPFKF